MMKYRKSRPPRNSGGSGDWITTYADMITNILVFFVLIFAASTVDVHKFQAILHSFQNRNIFEFYPSVIPFDEGPGNSGAVDGTMDEGTPDKGSLDYLYEEVNQYLQQLGLEDIVATTRTEEGVILVLPEQILFNTAEAIVLDEAKPVLNRVGQLLKDMPNMVRVEGHSDSRPIRNEVYPSNWELSAARAGSVIRYFIDTHDLDPDRFMAVGFGETRPVAPNDGPENWAKNRRVEIVILEQDPEQNNGDSIEG